MENAQKTILAKEIMELLYERSTGPSAAISILVNLLATLICVCSKDEDAMGPLLESVIANLRTSVEAAHAIVE